MVNYNDLLQITKYFRFLYAIIWLTVKSILPKPAASLM